MGCGCGSSENRATTAYKVKLPPVDGAEPEVVYVEDLGELRTLRASLGPAGVKLRAVQVQKSEMLEWVAARAEAS